MCSLILLPEYYSRIHLHFKTHIKNYALKTNKHPHHVVLLYFSEVSCNVKKPLGQSLDHLLISAKFISRVSVPPLVTCEFSDECQKSYPGLDQDEGTTRPFPTALPLLRAAVVVMGVGNSEESLVSSHRVFKKGRQAWWELGEMRQIPAAGLRSAQKDGRPRKERGVLNIGRSKPSMQLPIPSVSGQLKRGQCPLISILPFSFVNQLSL